MFINLLSIINELHDVFCFFCLRLSTHILWPVVERHSSLSRSLRLKP